MFSFPFSEIQDYIPKTCRICISEDIAQHFTNLQYYECVTIPSSIPLHLWLTNDHTFDMLICSSDVIDSLCFLTKPLSYLWCQIEESKRQTLLAYLSRFDLDIKMESETGPIEIFCGKSTQLYILPKHIQADRLAKLFQTPFSNNVFNPPEQQQNAVHPSFPRLLGEEKPPIICKMTRSPLGSSFVIQ